MNSITQSVLIHGFFGLIFCLMVLFKKDQIISNQIVEFKMIDAPIKSIDQVAPEIKITKALPKIETKKIQNEVFGINRKSLTSDSESGVEVKTGNTLAKEMDDKKLNADDPDALPIPTDEYLISKMPKLISDIKIPYPIEAKKQGITGQVVMDILIDQNGSVREAKIVRGLGAGLTEAAMKAIYSFKFEPAFVSNQKVAVRIRYAINFVLE